MTPRPSEDTLLRADFPGRPPTHSGKVREMYDLGYEMLMVTSDRLSAFDVVFPNPIPGKGRVLTRLSAFWFRQLAPLGPTHFIEEPDAAFLSRFTPEPARYLGRCLRVKKAKTVKVECIVRGCLEGSAWQEYRQNGRISEHKLPAGLRLHDPLPEPLFTPSTKADEGHDENITFAQTVALVGEDTARQLRDRSLAVFIAARDHLAKVGITLADTKFEFGRRNGELLLIDEVLTPDSSRFLIPGPTGEPVSMDKQYVRDWLLQTDWNRKPPAPELPPEVVRHTSERYREIARRIVGEEVAE